MLTSYMATQRLESLPAKPLAQIDLLGKPCVLLPDGSRHVLTGKTAALVALTVIEGLPSCRRVAGMLWPESSESLARNNLRTLRHRLTRRLGVELLNSGEQLGLSPQTATVRPWNAEELADALVSGNAGRCMLLADLDLLQLEEFQDWLNTARQRLSQQQLSTLCSAQAAARGNGQSAQALNFARACIALEPLSERWHRQLIHTHAACGDRAAALAAYEDCKATLLDNLGATPDDQTRSLHLRILRSDRRAHTAEAPEPITIESTALAERDWQLERLELAFARGVSIVLHGEAGVGKTQLLKYFSREKAIFNVGIPAGVCQDPYAALAQVLLVTQRRYVLQLDRVHRIELARIAPQAFPEDEPSAAKVSSANLREALCHWSTVLRAKDVTMLAIDDLHNADARSQSAFASLIQPRPEQSNALPVIFSYRRGDISEDLASVIGLQLQHNRLEEVRLERLSLAGIESILRARGRDESTLRACAKKLMKATGGNPLFIIELTFFNFCDQIGIPNAHGGINLELLLQMRLASCSHTAQQLAFTAGVAMADFSVELAACVMRRTAIDLMPAWSELQARGLFGEAGLAHDLIRDAVLAALPDPIRVAMHRQVAAFLEDIGCVAAPVVRHWLAAHEFGRALPHAVIQLDMLADVCAETAYHRQVIFDILERLDGQFLLDNLWLTTRLSWIDLSEPMRARFETLIQRVECIAYKIEDKAWVAFERARHLLFAQGKAELGYVLLAEIAATVQISDRAALWIELVLSVAAHQIGKAPHGHARRATGIAARIPKDRENRNLQVAAFLVRSAFLLEHASRIREAASMMRTALAAGDRGASRQIRIRIAQVFCLGGFPAAGARHFRRSAEASGDYDPAEWVSARGLVYGRAALGCGRFREAIQCLEPLLTARTARSLHARTALAWGWITLGRPDLAEQHGTLEGIGIHGSSDVFVMNALLRSTLARRRGELGAAELQAAINTMHAASASPVFLGMLETALATLVASPAERVRVAARVLELVRPPHPSPGDLTSALLTLAEAHADAEPNALLFRPFAVEGAALARRGRIGGNDYQPDLLCRFARLLRNTDPDLAASLTHVAARWVRNACAHLPELARESFVNGHPVNSALLAL